MWVIHFLIKFFRKVLASICILVLHPFIVLVGLYIDDYLIPGESIEVVGLGFIAIYFILMSAYATLLTSLVLEYIWEISHLPYNYIYILLHIFPSSIAMFFVMKDGRFIIFGIITGLLYAVFDRLLFGVEGWVFSQWRGNKDKKL